MRDQALYKAPTPFNKNERPTHPPTKKKKNNKQKKKKKKKKKK
jgi:hypothetical protein